MNNIPELSDRKILSMRGRKNPVLPYRPYSMLVEKERTAEGTIEDTAVVFLTNSECPFHCLVCDLWKNTIDHRLEPGFIPVQIDWAVRQLSGTKRVRLYNSGSFFDPKAVPVSDYLCIAELLSGFKTVTVESHPAFIDENLVTFQKMLKAELEVAIGLETIHPGISASLNKRMSPDDFVRSVKFLKDNGIRTRAFILLRPPFLSEEEGIFWAKRSVDFAFSSGVECCTVIPVRAGNGAMDYLQRNGYFTPPLISSLEEVLEYGITLRAGRMFADTWNLDTFSRCDRCFGQREARIREMNLRQVILPEVNCRCNANVEDFKYLLPALH